MSHRWPVGRFLLLALLVQAFTPLLAQLVAPAGRKERAFTWRSWKPGL